MDYWIDGNNAFAVEPDPGSNKRPIGDRARGLRPIRESDCTGGPRPDDEELWVIVPHSVRSGDRALQIISRYHPRNQRQSAKSA